MNEWISVDEKLPKYTCKVICHGDRGVGIAHFTHGFVEGDFRFQCAESGDDEGMTGFHGARFNVTHWMPLPEPPKQ